MSSDVRQQQVCTQTVRFIRDTNPQIIIIIHNMGQYTRKQSLFIIGTKKTGTNQKPEQVRNLDTIK